MTTATGATLKVTLATINGENIPSSLWDVLPDHVAGAQWRGEIWDAAITLADWLTDDEEYSEDKLQDMSYQLADSECEDYYSNINRRVQELALWAVDDLDEEVASSGIYVGTLTDMNSAYLYCAMRGLYQTLAQWALEHSVELVKCEECSNSTEYSTGDVYSALCANCREVA